MKHRADGDVRFVPLPPQLVDLLRWHLKRWPAETGLIFTNDAQRSITPENYGKVWNRAKTRVWAPDQHSASAVPYSLRHTAASTMLRAGVPLPEVARRLGHSVDVLLRVYAGVFEDEVQRSNEAIDAELERQFSESPEHR